MRGEDNRGQQESITMIVMQYSYDSHVTTCRDDDQYIQRQQTDPGDDVFPVETEPDPDEE